MSRVAVQREELPMEASAVQRQQAKTAAELDALILAILACAFKGEL